MSDQKKKREKSIQSSISFQIERIRFGIFHTFNVTGWLTTLSYNKFNIRKKNVQVLIAKTRQSFPSEKEIDRKMNTHTHTVTERKTHDNMKQHKTNVKLLLIARCEHKYTTEEKH